jgi:hypothetical protein
LPYSLTMNSLHFTFLLLTILSIESIMGQNLSPEQIVQKNLDSYNKRDIEGFMSSFSDNITIHNFADQKLTANGLIEVRKMYKELFELSPNLHSTILNRIVFDNKVIDHESIMGRRGSKEVIELVLIYEVQEEKIHKITVIRKP